MASEEHITLSNFIKSVHKKLRQESNILGPDQAWQNHCEDKDNLQKYASAMQELATKHWENNYDKGQKAICRVKWVFEFILLYFCKEQEINRQRQREVAIGQQIELDLSNLCVNDTVDNFKLLDVGSCYNPFKIYECLDVTPVDIAPASEDVIKCDFLNVKLSRGIHYKSDNLEITSLPTTYFDVVVFSLFLEYLPNPKQRLLCCEKAYNLLKYEGILVVITPDSKHVGANANIMKSWRFILAKIGFSRIKYEKLPYLHCMVFRKSIKKEIAQRWASLQKKDLFHNEIIIPQGVSGN